MTEHLHSEQGAEGSSCHGDEEKRLFWGPSSSFDFGVPLVQEHAKQADEVHEEQVDEKYVSRIHNRVHTPFMVCTSLF